MSVPVILTYEILMLLLGGLLVLHATLRIKRLWENRQTAIPIEWIRDCVWFGIVIFILTLWPDGLYPYDAPRSSILFFAALVAFATALVENTQTNTGFIGLLKKSGKVFLVIGCLGFLFSAVRYLLVFRPNFLSEDFFYYVCTARHMASGIGDLSPICYFYFPGVYRFWRMVLHFSNGSLDSLQWAYFTVIVADALLVGAIVQRVTRNFCLSTLGCIWFILLYTQFGGFDGITEPIATFPILLALLFWGGKSLLGRAGLMRLFAIGCGLGLGLYIRQQAGFVSLGAMSFFITYLIQKKSEKIVDLKRLLILPLIAAAVLITGILLEGDGFQPLILGLVKIPSYDYHLGTRFGTALWTFVDRSPLFTIFTVAAFVVWLVYLLRFRSVVVQPGFQMLGFTLIAGIFSLFSFLGRPHLHYALFSGAMFVIASTLAADAILRAAPRAFKQSAPYYFVLLVLTVGPFVGKTIDAYYVWPPEKPTIPPRHRVPYLASGPMADFKFMKEHLRRFEKIYVLPPSENQFHFFFGNNLPNLWMVFSSPAGGRNSFSRASRGDRCESKRNVSLLSRSCSFHFSI